LRAAGVSRKSGFSPANDDFIVVLSKPGSDFDAETSSVLLNGVFRILRAAGVEILLIQNTQGAGRSTPTSSARYARFFTFRRLLPVQDGERAWRLNSSQLLWLKGATSAIEKRSMY
jgi:hypothetical protein